jgi:type IV pilus assembly protein PilX
MQVIKSHAEKSCVTCRRQCGATLILSLILLALMGLGAAAAVRSSLSSQQAADNFQRELMAHQYAEAGLRYCEAQMLRPPADRPWPLQGIDSAAATQSKWDTPTTWSSGDIVTVPNGWIGDAANSTFISLMPPQCLVEKYTLPDQSDALRVTARGFSPGYSADANGRTASGSVVWLQSTILIQ